MEPPENRGRPAPSAAATIPAADDPPLTDRDVAERLGVSPRTVRRWRARGLLAFAKIAGTVRIRWSDVDRASRPGRDADPEQAD